MIQHVESNASTGAVTVTTITAEAVTVTVDGQLVVTRDPTADELAALNPEPEADPVELLTAQVAELTAALEALTGGG